MSNKPSESSSTEPKVPRTFAETHGSSDTSASLPTSITAFMTQAMQPLLTVPSFIGFTVLSAVWFYLQNYQANAIWLYVFDTWNELTDHNVATPVWVFLTFLSPSIWILAFIFGVRVYNHSQQRRHGDFFWAFVVALWIGEMLGVTVLAVTDGMVRILWCLVLWLAELVGGDGGIGALPLWLQPSSKLFDG